MNLANRVSLFRIFLIPVFVITVLYYAPQKDWLRYLSASIFILLVISDVLDGYIARKSKQMTQIGALLDPVADKLLINTAFISLFIRKELWKGFVIPIWVPLVILSRDFLLLVGSLLIHLSYGKLEIKPTLLGKITTFFQTLSIISIILHFFLAPLILYITGFLTIVSGIDYLWKGSSWLPKHET